MVFMALQCVAFSLEIVIFGLNSHVQFSFNENSIVWKLFNLWLKDGVVYDMFIDTTDNTCEVQMLKSNPEIEYHQGKKVSIWICVRSMCFDVLLYLQKSKIKSVCLPKPVPLAFFLSRTFAYHSTGVENTMHTFTISYWWTTISSFRELWLVGVIFHHG